MAPMRALAIAAVMLSMTWTVEASVAVVPDGDRAVLRDGEGRQLVSFSGVELSVSWMGAAGRTYQLYRAESLDDEFLPYGEPVAGVAGEITVDIPKGESPSAFFRVKVNELD